VFRKTNGGVETFLGNGSHFKGDLLVQGRLRVDGAVEGNLQADWLVVGPKARIRGDIRGRGINIAGDVEGNVVGTELIEILSRGVVNGDIVCPRLSIHEGGKFSGRSTMSETPASSKNSSAGS